jgi:hypothetical protein
MPLGYQLRGHLKSAVRAAVEWPAHKLGYRIRPAVDFLDLRAQTDDPVEGLYLSTDRPFLIDIDLDALRGTTVLSMPFQRGIDHPLIDTVEAYLAGHCGEFQGSPLDDFYSQWTPPNAAATLGLDPVRSSAALVSLPAYAATSPWFKHEPKTHQRIRDAVIREENTRYGAGLGPEHGTLACGPWSREKGELEFRRLALLADSIRERGYVPSDTPDECLRGHILLRGGEWRVKIRNGNHRLAALAAFGWSRVPILITSQSGTPRREEIAHWPNVRSGAFTIDEATAIFDRMFEGSKPSDYVSSRRRSRLKIATIGGTGASVGQQRPVREG